MSIVSARRSAAGEPGHLHLLGVDFTSSPRRQKPITVAGGCLSGDGVRLETLEQCDDWPSFEAVLRRPGPWLGAFDFPLGLPREAVIDLGWPQAWPVLVEHCARMGRKAFRAALDAYRQSRPYGSRYAHRATDQPAGSHSPLKLVNPPVGLMYFEGAPRLLAANVSVAGMFDGDPARIAVEAYPGFVARMVEPGSYKSDDRQRQTPAREAARGRILEALEAGTHGLGLRLRLDPGHRASLLADPSGDRLDAVLALTQAGWCAQRQARNFGLPPDLDPLEGWIAGVPA